MPQHSFINLIHIFKIITTTSLLLQLLAEAVAAMPSAAGADHGGWFGSGTERCGGNMSYLGSGAKNEVYLCDADKHVRRVSFFAGLSDPTVSACRIDTAVLLEAFRRFEAMRRASALPASKAMEEATLVLRARKQRSIDLVAVQTLESERVLTSRAAGTPTSFGVNVPLSSSSFPVPFWPPEILLCDNKRGDGGQLTAGGSETQVLDLMMVVERQLFRGKSADKVRSMSEADRFVLLHGWLSGQVDFAVHAGTFHIDGHPGNLLVNTTGGLGTTFMWNDFGRTSSFPGHPETQMARTIENVAKSVLAMDPSDEMLRQVAKDLEQMTSFDRTVFEALLNRLESSPHMKDRAVLARLGGRIGVRVARLESNVSSLESRVDAQSKVIAEQNATHTATLQAQANVIAKLEGLIAELSNKVASLQSQNEPNKLEKQIAVLPAEPEKLRAAKTDAEPLGEIEPRDHRTSQSEQRDDDEHTGL